MLNLNANIVYHADLVRAKREIKRATELALKKKRPFSHYDAILAREAMRTQQIYDNLTLALSAI